MTTVAAARPVDEAAIRALQEEAIAWLRSRGTDQWQNLRPTRRGTGRSLADAISRGEVYLIRDAVGLIGTVTVDDYADPEFWTPDDDPSDAVYIHRMVVARRASGQDVGGQMIAWALDRTRALGRTWLRLDAWRTNASLHAYYLQHGFELVRTVDVTHRGSGTLFQRRADIDEHTSDTHHQNRVPPDARKGQ
jgi:GNAT superfamily N-acetyltransferase